VLPFMEVIYLLAYITSDYKMALTNMSKQS
jgi:hypothetical protein